MSSIWADLLLGLCCLAAAISIFIDWRFTQALRRLEWWDPPEPLADVSELISVVVPVRNEARDIAAGLQSVLRQTGVELEVIVINDHSTDATGPLIDGIAATDGRISVIHNPDLRPGWLGKVNAMQHAADRARGAYLLFTDADVEHAPTCFQQVLARLRRERLDLFSAFPRLDCVTFWENVLLPMYEAGMVQFAGPSIFDEKSPDAVAAGALMLVRTEAFRAIGGWEPLKREMVDDIEMARLLKRNGFRVGFRAAPDLMRVRLFKGNRDAFWGTTKNILAGLGGRYWIAPLAMLVPFVVFWSPLIAIVLGLAWGSPLLALTGGAVYGLQYAGLFLGRELFAFRWWRTLFSPLVAIPVFCCFARALYHYWGSGSIVRRNRVVRVAEDASA